MCCLLQCQGHRKMLITCLLTKYMNDIGYFHLIDYSSLKFLSSCVLFYLFIFFCIKKPFTSLLSKEHFLPSVLKLQKHCLPGSQSTALISGHTITCPRRPTLPHISEPHVFWTYTGIIHQWMNSLQTWLETPRPSEKINKYELLPCLILKWCPI